MAKQLQAQYIKNPQSAQKNQKKTDFILES